VSVAVQPLFQDWTAKLATLASGASTGETAKEEKEEFISIYLAVLGKLNQTVRLIELF
jgi:hypothetical protein